MNIWVIGRNYPSDINNLQGAFELEQAKMLSKHGHKVSYISCPFHFRKKSKKWGYDVWEEDGVSIFTYAQVFFPERVRIHLESFRMCIWEKVLSNVEKESGVPDIIHIHYPTYIGMAKLFLKYKDNNVKIICTEHWTHVLNHTLDDYETSQLKSYVNKADAFLCVGHTLKEAVEDITATSKNISVVPDTVNTTIFKPASKETGKYNFVAVGRLYPSKQFEKIITAFSDRFKDKKNVSLTIIGDGEETKSLENLVKALNQENQIVLTGRLGRIATANKIATSNCLICYSRLETFGVPVIEGWACGIPVIASTATAVIDNWNARLGIQTDPNNISDLEEKMLEVYQNQEDYNCDYISEFARAHYSEEAVYNILLKYYNGEN